MGTVGSMRPFPPSFLLCLFHLPSLLLLSLSLPFSFLLYFCLSICVSVFLILVHSLSFSLLLSPSRPVSVCLSQCIFHIPDPHAHLPSHPVPRAGICLGPLGVCRAPSTIGEGTRVTYLSFPKMKDRKSPLEKSFSIRPGSSWHF